MTNILNKALSDEEFIDIALKVFPITQQGLSRKFKYRMTNRDIQKLDYFCGDLISKKILAASGSSIPLFSFLANQNSPEVIYGFDYSPKQIAYNYLVKYAIKDLSLEDFRNFFGYNGPKIRSKKNKEIRRCLIKQIPPQLRQYLTYNHELTKRDLKLMKSSNCLFLSNEADYHQIKKNIKRIKFFVLNLNASFKQKLHLLFPNNFFDLIYLSNVLDWICWHNAITDSDIDKIIYMLKDVSKEDAVVIIDHLAKRITLLSNYLKKRDPLEISSYKMYTYYWEMYKLRFRKK